MKRAKAPKPFLCALLVLLLLAGCGSGEEAANVGGTEILPQTSEEAPEQEEESTVEESTETIAPVQTEAAEEDPAVTTEPEETEETAKPEEVSEIDRLLSEMTLREKVGQLFIVRPEALVPGVTNFYEKTAAKTTELTEDMKETLQDYPVGGVALFSRNITDPEQLTAFNQAFWDASQIPMFLSVDEEGGQVSRLANHEAFDLPTYESAAAVGASGDRQDAFDMGREIGAYLREYGFNMDFAPVADVNTNPNNPIIGTRAFSSQGETAAEMASAMAEGLKEETIIPVYKHFPGHGDTAEDSHSGLAVSYKTREELESCEWLPFRQAGEGDCVMVGYIALPNVTGDMTPAAMSYPIVTEILREELGFEGLVITDALEMGAVTETYDSGEAAVAAFQAGCDILLMPRNLKEAFDTVVSAVEDGTISQTRLDESVSRILEYKLNMVTK